MPETIDQIFVIVKHWLLGYVPVEVQPLFSALLSVVPILVVFPLLFAITTLLERKGLGRIQNRYGPNRTGPYGLLQPIADAVKSLTKEDVVPNTADEVVHFLAPLLLVSAALLAYAVLPVGRNMIVANLNAGVLFFFAVGSLVELAVFMAGWSSRNKYSLLGAMRAIAQMISYEVPLVLASIVVIMAAGSLSTVAIVKAQAGYAGIWPHWFVFTPWGFAGFVLFMIAATAESNRSPFDLPEGESEIIAGYYIEYSGFKFALFFLGEYLGMFATSGMAITLFLGGWAAPFSFLTWVPSYFWFFSKLLVLIAGFIWVRGTLPRLRMDQLMNFAWRFMLPMALLNIFIAGVWHFMPAGLSRWLVCIILVAAPCILLSRGLKKEKKLQVRTYRFAE
ncbi:NADH-quinone oxidoreductase subunit H [Edaphobacter aggregans]|uniref:NADH-quinone oxidoreductase subunit H n=1 Tax=Edaphobacter aggregans TaxID=570835 RepID=A0A3R9WHG5_9BACT|nr:NADH-quinone oxidoreductase subunit NuoH [Edaphobacter aggregans]RSL17300.1 NADH-quinone oxidoreductase subunit H [Edaphobacter aggregans]